MMTPSWDAGHRRARRLWHDAPGQVAGERFLANTAQEHHPQIRDDLTRLPVPTHPRTLEALREHRLTRRFRHAAADRQTPTPITVVIHPAAVPTQVAIRLPTDR